MRIAVTTAACCLALSIMAPAQTKTKTTTTRTTHPVEKKAPVTPRKPAGPVEPKAIIETSMGNIHCTLFPDKTPMAVANFIGLATGRKVWTDPKTHMKRVGVPLYDGTTFHRVIPEFMIQGGDPLGTGEGDPGYRFKDELVPSLKFDVAGRLAYANSGPNTNGSQFFITETPQPHLDACYDEEGCVRGTRIVRPGYGYVIFGQCEDLDVVNAIARVPRDTANHNKPLTPVVIKHIAIIEPPRVIKKRAIYHPVRRVTKPPVKR